MKVRDILTKLLEWRPPEPFFTFHFPSPDQLEKFVEFLTTIGHSIPDRDFVRVDSCSIQVVEHKIGYQVMQAAKAVGGRVTGSTMKAA